MKRYYPILFAMAFLWNTIPANAQQYIDKAVGELTSISGIITSEEHSCTKDPKTGRLDSKKDMYAFTLKEEQRNILDKLRESFRQDRPNAYREETAIGRQQENMRYSTDINDLLNRNRFNILPYSDYIIMYFVQPGDTSMNNRLCYSLAWKEDKETKTISAQIHITLNNNQGYIINKAGFNQPYTQFNISADQPFYNIPHLYIQQPLKSLEKDSLWVQRVKESMDMDLDDEKWMKKFNSYMEMLKKYDITVPIYPVRLNMLSKNAERVSKKSKQDAAKALKEIEKTMKDGEIKELIKETIDNLQK